MQANILVVDDEKEIADLVQVYLENEGFTVYKCYTGKEALKVIEEKDLDLALLDVMLPEMDGFSLCRIIRQKYTWPVIMLTARGEEMDKINGLSLGADDYITKPFSPLEMVARVKAQLRRARLCIAKGRKRKRMCWILPAFSSTRAPTPASSMSGR